MAKRNPGGLLEAHPHGIQALPPVRPNADRFTLYLRIFRGDNGSLIRAFRNSEMNSHGGAMQFRIRREGDELQFSARPDTTQPEIHLTGTFAHSPDRLQVFWPDLGRVLNLKRRTPSQAADFFPRPPGGPKLTYHPHIRSRIRTRPCNKIAACFSYPLSSCHALADSL